MDKHKQIAFQACLDYIQKSGWISLNLSEIAQQLGLTYQEMHRIFPDKMHILSTFAYHIDQQTLVQTMDLSDNDSYRDRLFAITMARFEVAEPYKKVIQVLWKECLQDPQLILQGFSSGMTSVTWLLDVAGLETIGWANLVRVKIFAFVYLNIVKIWLEDDTPDMARTMAGLDNHLDRLSQLPGFF